jgi:phage baseplate assembly protein W
MNTDTLGRGWGLPVSTCKPKGDTSTPHTINLVSDEECVRQAIWMILSTAPGERVMRPEFGCGMHNLVFAAASPETAGHVASLVREALVRWEPRVEVLDVRAEADDVEPGVLLIAVAYRIRSTSAPASLVYPFYLE